MANGEMLKELRSLAEADKISTSSALRLLCSVTAEMYEGVKGMAGVQDAYQKDLDRLRSDLCDHIEDEDERRDDLIQEVNGKLDKVLAGIQGLSEEVEAIRKNPAVLLGDFTRRHPRWAAAIAFGIFLLFNLWFISGFRRYMLILANVPPEIIEVLAPVGAASPPIIPSVVGTPIPPIPTYLP